MSPARPRRIVPCTAHLPSGLFRLAGAILCATLAGLSSGGAQTVTVRSGEHADFTRLALVVSPPTGWSLMREGDGYIFALERDTLRLDISEVFRFIPRNRLAELRSAPDAPALSLRLACDCDVRAFEDRPGILVIDIRDPAAPVLPPVPEGGPRPSQMPGADLATLGLARDLLAPRLAPDAVPLAPETGTSDAAPTTATAAPATSEPPVPEPAPEPAAPPLLPAPDGQAERLARAIARAATQGLVSPPRPGPRPAGSAPDRPEAEGAATAVPLPGIRTGTAVDLAAGAAMATDPRAEALRCLPDSQLDLAGWGSELPPAMALGAALSATTGEFDRVNADAVRDLARLYLHLGFGAEARATLRAFALPEAPGDAILLALATIIDHGAEIEPSNLWQMTDCPGQAALWSVLARPDLPDDIVINESAMLQAFAGLPAHLRRHLGPRLAERLLASGRQTLATGVIEAVRHRAADNAAALELALARVALNRGEPSATRQLEALAGGHDEAALGARILLAQSILDRGAAPDPAEIAALEAEAFMRRGTDDFARLMRVVVLGQASLGDFPAALAAMSRAGVGSSVQSADGPPLWAELLTRAARGTPDPEFLRVVLSLDDWHGGQSPATLRYELSDRLLALGLPGLAGDALSPGSTRPEERLRLARILLEQDFPAEALRRLAGLDSAEAAGLRARALEALGDVGGAIGAHERAGDTDALARLVWRAGIWDRVQAIGAAEERAVLAIPVATPAADGPEAPAAAPPRLSEARAAIDASRELRASIESLLSFHPSP